jgi:hypothetical protein
MDAAYSGPGDAKHKRETIIENYPQQWERSVQDVWSFWVEKALPLTWLNRLRMPATDSSICIPRFMVCQPEKILFECGIRESMQ